ncbi:MAG: SGNH/GDSL hydrolase family protein [Paracoccaceae bacterium]
MASLFLRLVSAIGVGAGLTLAVVGGTHGIGQAALGLVEEPRLDAPPFRWRLLPTDRPVRLLLLGTSLTGRGAAWVSALEARLAACHGGPVAVERLARAGANSVWGATALRARLAEAPLPDLIVAEFSINDASLWHGITLSRSRVQHVEILQTAATADVPLWLSTASPAFGREAWERPGQMAYRAFYPDLARTLGAGLIAMAPDWQALDPASRASALPDDLHPTDQAMIDRAVPRLVAALGPVLCPSGG